MSTLDTDWIQPGADVVVYRRRSGDPDDLMQRSTVEKVAAKSFTVAGLTERIKLDTLTSKSIGGTWSSWNYVVVAPDDPKVAELEARQRRVQAAAKAASAVKDWDTGHGRSDREKVQAVIDAFSALCDTL